MQKAALSVNCTRAIDLCMDMIKVKNELYREVKLPKCFSNVDCSNLDLPLELTRGVTRVLENCNSEYRFTCQKYCETMLSTLITFPTKINSGKFKILVKTIKINRT